MQENVPLINFYNTPTMDEKHSSMLYFSCVHVFNKGIECTPDETLQCSSLGMTQQQQTDQIEEDSCQKEHWQPILANYRISEIYGTKRRLLSSLHPCQLKVSQLLAHNFVGSSREYESASKCGKDFSIILPERNQMYPLFNLLS